MNILTRGFIYPPLNVTTADSLHRAVAMDDHSHQAETKSPLLNTFYTKSR
jgi:hypothetical protein